MWKNEDPNVEVKYQNVHDKSTDRSQIKLSITKDSIDKGNIKKKEKIIKEVVAKKSKQESKNFDSIVKGKPIYLDVKPRILQNPQMHLFTQVENYTVCPYCKYIGSLDVEYKQSNYQKKCCVMLALSGLFLCSWIPLIIRSLSDQLYKCSNCKKELKAVAYNQIL